MSRRANTVREVRSRSLGSRTRLLDEIAIPMPLYHGGRGVRWLLRHWRGAGAALLLLYLWGSTGTLVGAVLVEGFLLGGGLTAWLLWRARRAEGASQSLRGTWRAHRQRATLVRQWDLACRTAGLEGPDRGGPPALHRVRTDSHGTITATVRSGAIGVPVPAIQRQTVTLAEVIGCREVVVTPTAPGVAGLAFHWSDPIGRALPLAEVPVAPKNQLAYGIRQDGAVATIRADASVLIGGLTGTGKSSVVWALLADCIRQGIHVDLYVSDPKGGVELDAFEARVGAQVTGLVRVRQYAKTAKETVEMITAVEKAMHCRQDWMKTNGTRKIIPDQVNPLVVTILDETLPLTDILKRGTDSPLGRVAYTGRAAGYVVWANTQVAQVDAIGRFRDLIPQRICFATPNPQVTDSVLGQGSEAVGARCSELHDPGVGYSYSEGAHHPRKFRSAKVEDAETKGIAAGRLPKRVADRARELYDLEAENGERTAKSRSCALYRWFYPDASEGDRPAYIGISYDVLQREAEHNQSLRAFMAGDCKRTVEYYPTRKAALAAERAAILREQPLYNVQHNGRNPNRRTDRVRSAVRRVTGGLDRDDT